MNDRLCIECFNELDDEYEPGDRCLSCEEGCPDTSWWETWNDFEQVDMDELDAEYEEED